MPPTASAVLVDASPYIFRAHFSLPSSLVDGAGRPVAATYGFVRFLVDLVEQESPEHLGVAFDWSLTTSFRNDIYPAYKAHREPPPVELEAQLDDCREAAAAFGAETFLAKSYEADDLLGTLCAQLEETGLCAMVVSSDKDLAQLVGDQVTLLDRPGGDPLGSDEVREKLGVDPEQVPDYLGLAGDRVDNIPGVKGVGPATARTLLAAFPHLEELYEDLDRVAALEIRGAASLKTRLEAGRENAFLSRRLATVARDAPVRADLDTLRFRGADRARIESLFARLGFRRLGERIRYRPTG